MFRKALALIFVLMFLFSISTFAANEDVIMSTVFHLLGTPRGTSTMSSSSTVVPLTFNLVIKNIGNSSTAPVTLANGYAHQILVFEIGTVGTGSPTCALTPATCTNFTTITFGTAKQSVTLEYVDDTIGWIIIGTVGAPTVA